MLCSWAFHPVLPVCLSLLLADFGCCWFSWVCAPVHFLFGYLRRGAESPRFNACGSGYGTLVGFIVVYTTFRPPLFPCNFSNALVVVPSLVRSNSLTILLRDAFSMAISDPFGPGGSPLCLHARSLDLREKQQPHLVPQGFAGSSR